MARPAPKRRGVRGQVGNYVADIDTVGMSDEDKALFTGTKANKVESDYIKGTGGRASAIEAVRRARKANKQPPLKGY